MLPSSLKSIYQQYKADTGHVANWLATTAKAHGYTDNASNPNNPPANSGRPGGRPKGKARKQAKAKAQPKPGNVAPGTTSVIRIKDFTPMASYLASIDSVKVPDDLAVALERVIWVRNTFHERLSAKGVRITPDSQERHSFFIMVLEKVRDYLKPLMRAGDFKAEDSTKVTANISQGPFKKIFDVLDVYAPSETFLNAPDAVVPRSTTEVKYTVEQDETLSGAIFALLALLDDYDRLRQEVMSLWEAYNTDNLDLAAVSIATNTAFELARSMEDETKSILDKHGGAANMATSYFFALSKQSGIDPQDTQLPGDAYNIEAYGLAQPCLINTISLLASYANSTSDDTIVNNYNGKFGWYNEVLGSSGQTYRERYDQDKTAMFEILPDLHFLSSNMGRGAVEDELIRGIYSLIKDPESGVPLWLAWTAQIYLDILQFLGVNCARGFNQMQQESLRIQKAMLDVPSSSPERRTVLSVATKWDKDPIWTCRNQMMALNLLSGGCSPAYKFLRRNPIHCGLLTHNMRVTLHEAGVHFAAPPGGLMSAVQLYHALRQEKLLPDKLVWDDLDTFWTMQGNATFFVGDPPTNREGYFRNYCLSIGVSTSNGAPTRRKGKVNANTANKRNMRFRGWVSSVVNRRFAPTGERPALSPDLVAGILTEGRRRGAMDGKGHVQPEIKDTAEDAVMPRSLISFDYFTMHNTAWAFLGELKKEFTRLRGTQFLQYVPAEDKLPFVVGYVFSTAAGRTGFANEERGDSVEDLINAAGKVLCDFLTKGHGRAVENRSKTIVEPEELADIEFGNYDPWGMDKLIAKIEKMGLTSGGMGGGAGGQDCPVQ
ncbi:hypothetical protein B0J13DRAFT_659526 [Dactylonectria estremocensis]|uniref:DUF6604 domain-containing protein n=1 Tax=Dactylonectria estremocensis TaxID=1079267 RepID=A0A9P9D3V7_9HYPO|nr:hypothetical protein B0J13DRAFT_659526 [Dactylonectria estremocensis]